MTDAQVRCDRHVGEAYPSRCYACESLQAEMAALPPTWEERKEEVLDLLQQALALLDRIDARTKESTK